MSDRQQLAEKATQVGLAGLAIGGVAVSVPIASALVPAAALAALGLDLLGKSEKRAVEKAIKSAFNALKAYPDLTAQDLADATGLLRDNNARLMIDPQALANASSRRDLANGMLEPLFDSATVSIDGAVASALRSVMGAVFDALRGMEPFRQALSDEQLRLLVGRSEVFENYLKKTYQKVGKIDSKVDKHERLSNSTQMIYAINPARSRVRPDGRPGVTMDTGLP